MFKQVRLKLIVFLGHKNSDLEQLKKYMHRIRDQNYIIFNLTLQSNKLFSYNDSIE